MNTAGFQVLERASRQPVATTVHAKRQRPRLGPPIKYASALRDALLPSSATNRWVKHRCISTAALKPVPERILWAPNAMPAAWHTKDAMGALAEEVRANVVQQTGWQVPPTPVNIQWLVPMSFDLVVREHTDVTHVLWRAAMAGMVTGYLFSQKLVGLYSSKTRRVYLVRERLLGVSENELKAVLHHEMVHAAQHHRHPRLFDLYHKSAARGDMALSGAISRLVEGHARLMERDARTWWYAAPGEGASMGYIDPQAREDDDTYSGADILADLRTQVKDFNVAIDRLFRSPTRVQALFAQSRCERKAPSST